ncbi:MAG: ABC transporter substrate-binding protein [Patescibacteria group bacterium]
MLFYLFLFLLVGGIIGSALYFYYSKTQAQPDFGGEYIEGIVGQPLHLNPVIAPSNETDSDMAEIIYSSLLRYDFEGRLENDLAESYEVSEDRTTYTVHLKQNVLWHDGEKLTAEDVVFTLNLISNPAFKSPLRGNWQGVEFSQDGDFTVVFKTQNPYVGFVHNLTFGVLPKHIWESIDADKFSLTDLNMEPIGSGPYKYTTYQKDSDGNILSYKLVAYPGYHNGKPYISKLTFNFYGDEEEAIEAYNKKEIMGLGGITPTKLPLVKLPQSTFIHKLNTPRYFSVFLNQNRSIALAHDEVREALNLATDRESIIREVLEGNGHSVFSPILPGMIGYREDLGRTDFNLDKANGLLDEKGWKKGEDGIRSKDGTVLEVNLITTEWEELVKTAEILKSQWEMAGARVNLNILSISDMQQNYIRPREYDALLFGQVLGADPDLYSFWHSNQKKDPGLNLSLFGEEETDKLIEEGRVEFNNDERAKKYTEFQEKLAKEVPAIFLYSPDYLYIVNKKIKGLDTQNLSIPSRRFSQIEKWFINTDRVWK